MYDTIRVTSGPWRTLISLVTSFTLPILPPTKGRLLPSLHAYELCVCVSVYVFTVSGSEHEYWFMCGMFLYVCVYVSVGTSVSGLGSLYIAIEVIMLCCNLILCLYCTKYLYSWLIVSISSSSQKRKCTEGDVLHVSSRAGDL